MRLSRTRSRLSSSGAWRATSSSKVALASSIIAHSSPFISIPWRSNRAGSTVSTQTRSPRAAIPSAIAAAVVVLPTPPEPAQMQMSRPSRISSTAGISGWPGARRCASSRRAWLGARSSEPLRELPCRLDAQLRLEEEGEGLDRGLDPAPQAGELGALGAGAGGLGGGGAGGGAGDPVLATGQLGQPLGLLFGEALRVEPVEVDAVDGDADLGAQLALQGRRLVDRHLLRQGDDRGAGVLVIGDQAVELLRLGVDRADAGDRGEGARRLQEPDPLPGGGGVDDHQVVLASLLHPVSYTHLRA